MRKLGGQAGSQAHGPVTTVALTAAELGKRKQTKGDEGARLSFEHLAWACVSVLIWSRALGPVTWVVACVGTSSSACYKLETEIVSVANY